MKKISIFLIFALGCLASIFIYNDYKKDIENNRIEKIETIKKHFNSFVKTNKEAKIYEINNDEYIEKGHISINTPLQLSEIVIDENTKYFHISEMDYYIEALDVEPIKKITKQDTQYKNYVVFNENIITNETTTFYDNNGNNYTIKQSYDLPIIIKDNDRYYVEVFNKLLYVKKEDIKEIKENNNTTSKTRENIRTFAYHFVYKENENCDNPYICHPESQFISHMKYLKENEYFTLTMKDLKLFLEGKIQIPEKSVVITLDDGHLMENAIEILDEYQIHATYFVITSWVDIASVKSEYVNLQSHTNNMHNNYKCPGGNQGGQILCEDEELIKQDLKTSQEKLNGAIAFAYPFYDYNNRVINILKETGFELAFIGADTTLGLANQNTDLFKIPRLTLSSLTTMEDFIDCLK